MRPILIILLLLFQSNSFAEVQENNDTIDYARTGDYFPYVPLTDKDSLYYPITYEIELFVNDESQSQQILVLLFDNKYSITCASMLDSEFSPTNKKL